MHHVHPYPSAVLTKPVVNVFANLQVLVLALVSHRVMVLLHLELWWSLEDLNSGKEGKQIDYVDLQEVRLLVATKVVKDHDFAGSGVAKMAVVNLRISYETTENLSKSVGDH